MPHCRFLSAAGVALGAGVGGTGCVPGVGNLEARPEGGREGGEVLGVGRFPCGAGIVPAQGWAARRMGQLSRVPQFALKVSLGTLQFSFSPPFVFLCGIGEFGRVQPLEPFLLTLLLLIFSHSSSEEGKADSLQWSSLYSLFLS